MIRARTEASLSAYTTAFDWFQRYPAAEVERRLIEIIEAKRNALHKLEAG